MECKNRSTLITDDMEMAREQEWIFQRAASFATTYYKQGLYNECYIVYMKYACATVPADDPEPASTPKSESGIRNIVFLNPTDSLII